jgi:transcriptional regulator with XRE-family HTH domain
VAIAIAQQAIYHSGMKLAELIRTERERRAWSVRKLAGKAEVDPSAISRIENGKQIGHATTLAAVARALGIDPALLQGVVSGDDDVRLPEQRSLVDAAEEMLAMARRLESTHYAPLPGGVIMVPVVSGIPTAGEGGVAEVEYWPYIPTPEQVGHEIVGAVVKGDCLAPRVVSGQRIYIDRSAAPKLTDVVAVQVDGESLLRILAEGELIALNGHPPIPLSERVHIEGVVVFAGGKP